MPDRPPARYWVLDGALMGVLDATWPNCHACVAEAVAGGVTAGGRDDWLCTRLFYALVDVDTAPRDRRIGGACGGGGSPQDTAERGGEDGDDDDVSKSPAAAAGDADGGGAIAPADDNGDKSDDVRLQACGAAAFLHCLFRLRATARRAMSVGRDGRKNVFEQMCAFSTNICVRKISLICTQHIKLN